MTTESSQYIFTSKEDFVRFVRASDIENFFGECDDMAAVGFYVSCYMLGFDACDSVEDYIHYAEAIDKFFPDFSVHEGWGGMEADCGRDVIYDAMNFNIGEHGDWMLKDETHRAALEAMRSACIAMGIEVDPLDTFFE